MNNNDLIGRVVQSKAGRDTGKLFLVVKVIDEDYVLISDGRLRTKEKPKKKKLKHLIVTDFISDEIRSEIYKENAVTNSMIRRFLQLNGIDKEV